MRLLSDGAQDGMTEEELARFALVLREAELVRSRIAGDEAAARAEEGAGDYPMSVEEQPPGPAMAAVA
jgi:hypothetical protein